MLSHSILFHSLTFLGYAKLEQWRLKRDLNEICKIMGGPVWFERLSLSREVTN